MKLRVDTLYELVGENETKIESVKEQRNKIGRLNSDEVETVKNVTIPRMETSIKNLTDEIKKGTQTERS